MFKYNELSDLVDGSLVTPLSKMDDGSIRCLNSKGEECYYGFKDFDFRKKPEERSLNSSGLEAEVEGLIKDGSKPITKPVEEKKPELTYQDLLDQMEQEESPKEPIDPLPEENIDDSIYDGSEEYIEPEPDPDIPIEKENEGFCDDKEKWEVASIIGIKKDHGKDVEVWKDIL